MPLAVLVLALVAYAYALVAVPAFRRPGVAIALIIAIGLAVYFARSGSEATRSATRIAASELTLSDVALARTGRGATLSGRVTNGSPRYRLRDLTLAVRLRDCPEPSTSVDACPVIGEATAIARPDVPPGQIRALRAHFVFSSVPPVAGTLRWDWRITAIRATED
jgi:hypothetical protein